MVENWQEKCKTGNMIDTSKNTSMTSGEAASRLTYKLVRVEEDGTFDPASEDEITEVEHLLAEPKNEKVSVDAVLCYNNENPEKCLAIEDFPGSVDHNNQLKTDSGVLLSNITREWSDDSKFEFLDGMLQGVDEEDLHVTNGLSSACEDYLLDTEFVEKVPDLDYGTCGGPRSGNLGFESRSPGLSERDTGGAETLELSASTIPVLESTSDQNVLLLDKMTIQELHKAFKSTFGRETTVKDKQWLIRRISFGLQNFVELENASSLLESGISSKRNDGDMLLVCNNDSPGMYSSFTNVVGSKGKSVDQSVLRERLTGVDVYKTSYSEAKDIGFGFLSSRDREDTLATRKRLRKPTRRYIEETSDLKSRYCSGKLETPITSSKDKFMLSRSCNQHHWKEFVAMAPVCKQDSVGGSDSQVPFGLRMQKKRTKKNTSAWEHDPGDNKNDSLLLGPSHSSDLEPSPTESQDEMSDDCLSTVRTEKGRSRRKHHRLWTLSEVMKLVDGVSQYGVGRWTDIKRLLFASSAYRTSVDLKDKWRNLLRASGAELKSKREVEQGRKNASRPIPQSVLRRVSELAIIYPYPRERKSKLMPKLTSTALISTPIQAAPSADTSVSRRGRIVHRKSFT
ncbi:SANT/Myb domain [Macleaya cordata]|uniref:SANT/Myb domain n=1 Tax=Macleaya cordata TaxID=56857 RepID=A0A200QHX7_MACCD|nr:SANT/Myb domain [Macleaya cordata]